jgi:FkbM family methyltransferase
MWLLRRIFNRVAGRRRFQPLFTRIHRAALIGLNIGPADEVASSGERVVLGALDAASVVFDVGANVGDYSNLVESLVPNARVHAFEPSPTAFHALEASLGGRACLHGYGLGERDEEIALYAPAPGSPLASISQRRHPSAEWYPLERVRLRRLDDVCSEEAVTRIDLLKIDVEGHELAVLNGAATMLAEGRIQRIQFEFGGANIDSRTFLRDILDVLPRFALFRIVRDGLVEVRYEELWEVFTTTNFVAIRPS